MNTTTTNETIGNFEALERRRLLSASLVDGHLQVTGTAGDDVIAVFALPGSLVTYVNESDFVFEVADYPTQLLSITVDAGDGNDVVRIQDPYAILAVGATVYGGGGNDHLMGTRLEDVLHGGKGDDVLEGYAGNDQLFGNHGNDELYGGAGDDQVIGGQGKDLLFGGGGRDFFDKRDQNRNQLFDLEEDDVIMRPNGRWI